MSKEIKNNTNKKRKNSITNKSKKEKNKMSNKERAWFADMNQIEWFPVDPYCD